MLPLPYMNYCKDKAGSKTAICPLLSVVPDRESQLSFCFEKALIL